MNIKKTYTVLPYLLAVFAPSAMTVSAATAHDTPTQVRQHILMDADWRFWQIKPIVMQNSIDIPKWHERKGEPGEAAQMTAANVDTTGGDWKEVTSHQETFGNANGFNWYRTTLPDLKSENRIMRFTAVDDNATVYLNGVKLTEHQGWNDLFDVPLDGAWKNDGPNVLTVLVENTGGGGGIMGPVTLGTIVKSAALDPSAPNMNDQSWRKVHLPHDYVIEGEFTPTADASHGSLPPSSAWYRKTFTLPKSDQGKALWLDFDGVYRDSTIYLNGQKLASHACGYTPFRVDISQAAHYGSKNLLAVYVNATKQEGWWYEGSGIYRHVWLNIAAPIHVAPWGVFVTSTLPEPGPDGTAPQATISVKTKIIGPGAVNQIEKLQIISQVIDPSGHIAASVTTGMPNSQTQDIAQTITIAHPSLWSIETPQLYRLHTEIRQGDRLVDATNTPFGIRTIRYDAEKGFFLNGKSVKIKGTCNHQDFIGVGVAMPDSLLSWRIKKLKDMGSNAYRCSHNPPTSELLDVCDKVGMIVMDENRHLGDTEDGKASQTTPYDDLHEVESMVLRDRNHPSIIMWSMCNEESIQSTAHGAKIFAAMKRVVDHADGSRPVTCAMIGGIGSPEGITSVEDLQGINYNPTIYDWFHQLRPTMPLFGSETSSEVGTRGIYGPDTFKIDNIEYLGDQAKGYVSAYDRHAPGWAQTAEAAWSAIADRPFVAGGFVWTGFDYKGEPTPYGWPDVNSNFGIMDMCGFPKDIYYYYQAAWGDKPLVHVLPHWNWAGKEGQSIDVWAFSNAARVELFLNGVTLGVKDMPRNGHLAWSVPYSPGILLAKGYDTDGKMIASDTVETTGAPAGLKLSTDRTTLTADGEDVTMVEVDVIDAQGRIVPTASDLVTFTLTGAARIAGVGNGDPSCHEPDQASQRHAFNGKCMVVIGANETGGTIHLTAATNGLQSADLVLNAH